MQSQATNLKKNYISLPETVWREALQQKFPIEKQSLTTIENQYGLWELFKYSDDCTALLFHSQCVYSQSLELDLSYSSKNLWGAFGCQLDVQTVNEESPRLNNDVILSDRINAKITLNIQATPGTGLMIIQLPKNILGTQEHESRKKKDTLEFTYIDKGSHAFQLAKDMFYKQCRPELHKCIMHGKIYEVVNAILPNKNPKSSEEQNHISLNQTERLTIANKAENILRKHYAAPPSLEQLAKRLGTNRNKLSQSFKAIHGKTVFEYCNQYRMTIAKRMLSKHPFSIAHVAGLVGYEYPGNFTSAYKRHFGELPKSTKRLHSI